MEFNKKRQIRKREEAGYRAGWISKVCLFAASLFILLHFCPMSASAYSAGNVGNIRSSTFTASFSFDNDVVVDLYTFKPTVTGRHYFKSALTTGDPYFYLCPTSAFGTAYQAIKNAGCRSSEAAAVSLLYADDSSGSRNFSTSYVCYVGQTYIIMITRYSVASSCKGSFTITAPSYGTANNTGIVTFDRQGGSGGHSGYYNVGGQAFLTPTSSEQTDQVSVPTKSGYTFLGYYTAATGGTQYIANNGIITNSAAKNSFNGTLYAQWQESSYVMTYNNQGAPNVTQVIDANAALPATVTIPTRSGYQFLGYFSLAIGGTQYYSATGEKMDGVSSETMTSHRTLYARWTPAVYTISYEGMENATYGSHHPESHTYGTATTISDPTKEILGEGQAAGEYTFMGWSINGSVGLNKALVLSATGYTGNITLKANWLKKTEAKVEVETSGDTSASLTANQADLANVFLYPADSAEQGVTSEELSGSAGVELVLTVKQTDGDSSGLQEIKNNAQGTVVEFFDATITKNVTDVNGYVTQSNLSEIPVAVAVKIPLSDEQQGKTAYTVYRYHTYEYTDSGTTETVSEIHQIDSDSSKTEYYTIAEDGTSITVYTRMFSVFAVVASEISLDPRPEEQGGTPSAGFDVQGRISQKGIEAVYKLDVSWGAMTFDFTTAKEWDPYTHSYGEPSYAWSSTSFDGTNNKITVINHSNSDVNAEISFVRTDDQLVNTEVSFHATNSILTDTATGMYLSKVPEEGANPEEHHLYLWLEGTPTTLPGDLNAASYTKVGVITLTFAGDSSLGLTPKND